MLTDSVHRLAYVHDRYPCRHPWGCSNLTAVSGTVPWWLWIASLMRLPG